MFERILNIDLPEKQSAFLWGARQTGKSFFLKQKFKDAVYYDLLDTHEFIRLSKAPYIMREELLSMESNTLKLPVIIDEIQRVPELLNEVHWLIENAKIKFILCGSSARRLKTSSTNLLGGRAWKYNFYPLVFPEIPDLDLLRVLRHGMIPNHYLAKPEYLQSHLESYVEVYLACEIRDEGLVRNLMGFARFLDVAGMSSGEMLNANNIARDCGIDRNTVQAYYQILIDTLLGYYIYPFRKKVKREIIKATPKFYLFDVGIANYLSKQDINALEGASAGKSFEHYILMELMAYKGINHKRYEITYWRTKTGLEVDFILGQAEVAIEVKISKTVHKQDLKGLIAFLEEYPSAKAIVVSLDKRKRKISIDNNSTIFIVPYALFLKELWDNKVI